MPSRPPARARPEPEAGQAAVELVALLPVLAVLALLAWQAAVAGQAVWLAGAAARSAARAAAVGADPEAAARRALTPALRRGLRVSADDRVVVGVAVRSVIGDRRLATVRMGAAFPEQGS